MDADELTAAGAGAARHPEGTLRAAIADAMVGMKKKYYGRGPEAAKAWVLDDYVFVAMEGGLNRAEETLVADGKEEDVRRFRLEFQESIAPVATLAIAELVGRKVLTYHSQIVFDPVRTFEMFVLGGEDVTPASES
jgi:uncharacterized protein YbcI